MMRRWTVKRNETSAKIETERSTFVLCTHVTFLYIHRMIDRLKQSFNLSWLRVQMSYHKFNNLAELLNGNLAAIIGQRSFPKTKWI